MKMLNQKLKTAMLLTLLTVCSNSAVRASFYYDDFTSVEEMPDDVMHPNDSSMKRSTNEQTSRPLKAESTKAYWLQKGKEFIRQQANGSFNKRVAKNIILFLGNGMGVTTFTAARNLLGGEEKQLSFEKFPHIGFSKTYALDGMVPDCACTATAYLCGVKGNSGTIGLNGQAERMSCEGMRNTSNHVHSIAKWALDAGKSAGLVTTTRVTDASPAGVYAHVAERDWENDVLLAADCGPDTGLPDTALQLIRGEVGKQLKVILGGGKQEFVDSRFYAKGKREDGNDLIKEFLQESVLNAYVETRKQLMNLNLNAYERLLGLFHKSHMEYNVVAQDTQPKLEEMTRRAIEMLQKDNDKGYFLFVEGGLIDRAHHKNMAEYALNETVEFHKAIEAARNLTSDKDTLIVVTADHSHTLTIAGYQSRGSDIFGIAPSLAADNKPYLALSYANGPGFGYYYNTKERRRQNVDIVHALYNTYPATVPLESATHGGEDVAVFASGPWSHLFTGVYEQNAIPHLMAYAACLGDGLKAC